MTTGNTVFQTESSSDTQELTAAMSHKEDLCKLNPEHIPSGRGDIGKEALL